MGIFTRSDERDIARQIEEGKRVLKHRKLQEEHEQEARKQQRKALEIARAKEQKRREAEKRAEEQRKAAEKLARDRRTIQERNEKAARERAQFKRYNSRWPRLCRAVAVTRRDAGAATVDGRDSTARAKTR